MFHEGRTKPFCIGSALHPAILVSSRESRYADVLIFLSKDLEGNLWLLSFTYSSMQKELRP